MEATHSSFQNVGMFNTHELESTLQGLSRKNRRRKISDSQEGICEDIEAQKGITTFRRLNSLVWLEQKILGERVGDDTVSRGQVTGNSAPAGFGTEPVGRRFSTSLRDTGHRLAYTPVRVSGSPELLNLSSV